MCPAAAGPPRALLLASSLLASLRARRGGLGTRHGSRASISVAERSDMRAAGSQEGSAPQPPPQPPAVPLPSGPELLRQHLTPTQCEHVTHEILRTFLAVDGSTGRASTNGSGRRGRRQAAGHAHSSDGSSSNGSGHHAAGSNSGRSSSSGNGSHRSHAGPSNNGSGGGGKGGQSASADAPAQQRRRGLQGQVAEHLLSGGFDEALLEPVPTHTLNWVIKVRRCAVLCWAASCQMQVSSRLPPPPPHPSAAVTATRAGARGAAAAGAG